MSSSYVQVWVLYHMDLRCILVSMLVYSSHGSSFYQSATMSLVTCVYESTYWCTTNAYLTTCSDRANIFISWWRLVLKALVYRITLRLMLWEASCYTKILSPSCDKTFDIPTCPKSQLLEWKIISFFNLFIQIPSTMLNPLSISATLVRTAHNLFPTSSATAYGP